MVPVGRSLPAQSSSESGAVGPDVPLWAPRLPRDAAGFAVWAAHPNWRVTSDRRRVFVSAVREAIADARAAHPGRPVRVLEIGCGWGIGDDRQVGPAFLAGIREVADELHGLEPDRDVRPAHGFFDYFEHSTLEEARLPSGDYDVAYAYYVVEHIDDPMGFLATVNRLLRPRGTFIFMTPNGRHWFSRLTRYLRAWRADEWALRLARGRRIVESYHYPVRHMLNDAEKVARHAHKSGFATADFAWFDHGDVLPYLPSLVHPLVNWWSRTKESRSREGLVCMLARLRRS